MNKPSARPAAVDMLCIAFWLWSILSLAVNVPRWHGPASDSDTTGYRIIVDLGAFGFLAAIWLRRLLPIGRTFALILTWYWLAGSVLLFFRVFPLPYLQVTSNSDFLAAVPTSVLRVFVVPFFLAQLWQLHLLNRPDIRALFRPVPKPAASD